MELEKFSEYASYKNSEVEWLGLIPRHWSVVRFRDLFSFGKGLTITKENLQDEGVPCINYGEVHSKYGFEVDPSRHPLKCVSEDYLKSSQKSLLLEGDIVFADTSEDIEGAGNFSQLTGSEQVFAGYHTIIARPDNRVNQRFLAYSIDSLSYRNQVRKSVKGVKVYSITQSILKNTCVWLPGAEEQKAIAMFLDEKVAKVNEAIAIKQQQVELLKERKKILIQKMVTQGLNSDIPMRDSGVDWIGQIPEHWEVSRSKYLFDEIDERSKGGSEELLSVSHMTGVTPRSEKNVSMFMAEDYTDSKTCQKDDLVFNVMWAWMGALGVSGCPGIVSPSYAVFRQKMARPFNVNYIELLLKSFGYIEHYNQVSTGLHSSRLRFYSHMFFDMKLGFPSRKEQDDIVAYIKSESGRIDSAVEIQALQLESLKEYKTTLINSAVTGKIRVPGVEGSPSVEDSPCVSVGTA